MTPEIAQEIDECRARLERLASDCGRLAAEVAAGNSDLVSTVSCIAFEAGQAAGRLTKLYLTAFGPGIAARRVAELYRGAWEGVIRFLPDEDQRARARAAYERGIAPAEDSLAS